MKKTALFIAALVASGSVYAQAQQSTAPALEFTFDATVVNEYIWRGQEQADWTFHPSLKATYGDAYLGVWAAMPFKESSSGSKEWTEFDFFGGYKFALNDTWSLDVGSTFYTFTDTAGYNPNSVEPYIGVSGKVADLLSTSFYGFYNFEYEATTLQASVGYSLPLEQLGTSLDFSATLGWVKGNSNLRESGDRPATKIHDYFYWSIGVAAPWKISDRAVLTVGVSYNDVNENAINNGADIVGSASLTVGF
ncbi:hypothetical protein OPIT5_16255 [Opitutaceae bacterium TAV5]|nr:hypothetical protein OPIT5_16255 [Opitutaceae bacterium TAV5]